MTSFDVVVPSDSNDFDLFLGSRKPRFSGTAIYGHPVYLTYMTRKDKMKKGFVARTFHLPIDIDDELRMMAVKNHVRFSEMAMLAFRGHISRVKGVSKS
jgi:hypothetical protein